MKSFYFSITLLNKAVNVYSFALVLDYLLGAFNLLLMHQSIPAAPSPPPPPSHPSGLLRGICPPFQSRGWGICKFCAARGQPRGYYRAFDSQAVSYQNITTQRILLGIKPISLSVKDRGCI